MEYHYIWFFLFFITAYFIITDNSVAEAFYYVIKLLKFQYEKTKWWFIHNPATPWAKYFMWRRSMKLAKELLEEFQSTRNKL